MPKPLYHPDRGQIELSAVLDALSDPIRRDIVLELATGPERNASWFCDRASKTNLTYHIGRLREAGVTRTRIDGAQRMLSLRRADLDARFPGLLDAVVAGAKAELELGPKRRDGRG